MSVLEYADDIFLLSGVSGKFQDFIDRQVNNEGMRRLRFPPSKSKMPSQDWIESETQPCSCRRTVE